MAVAHPRRDVSSVTTEYGLAILLHLQRFCRQSCLVYPLWPVTIVLDLLGFVVLLAVFRLRVVIAEKK